MSNGTPDPTADPTAPPDPIVGQKTGSSDALAQYIGPYVTDMLGRGAALADQPYYAYEGPLTAKAWEVLHPDRLLKKVLLTRT